MTEEQENIAMVITDDYGKEIERFQMDDNSMGVIEASIKRIRKVAFAELPIIPKYVASYVDIFKTKYEMTSVELLTLKDKHIPENIEKWLTDKPLNSYRFIIAVLLGYEVEEDE